MAIEFTTDPTSAGLVTKGAEGGAYINESAGEYGTASSAATEAIQAKIDAEAAKVAAEAAKVAAELAETNAETAETNAELAETNAETAYANTLAIYGSTQDVQDAVAEAQAAQTAAELAETNAETAYANVQSTINSAVATATADAEAAQAAAELAETNAETAEANAETAQGLAEDAQSAAETAEDNANDYASDAQKLAINPEDSQYTLSDGSTTGYSALHYSSKAEASATSAAGSALDASNYAASAASSLDSFDDRYLGSKTEDPELDNDGEALVTGALYYNSTEGAMYVFEGSNWIKASSSIVDTWDEFVYTATAGQTEFTGVDDNGNTLVTSDYLIVTRNGLRLTETDGWTKTSNTVTLTTAAELDDIIVVTTFSPVQLADILSLSAGGTVTGNVTFSGDVALNGAITGVDFSDIANKPTTLSGYGISDAATSTQGALADTALQPNDNISELTNDSGYITGYSVTENDVTQHQAALSVTESQISDLGDYTVDGSDVTFSSVQLTGGTNDEGTLSWNDSDRTLNLDQGGVTLQLGQETHMMVRNASGSAIGNGTFLGFTGVTVGSNRITAGPFNQSTMDAHMLVGFATEDISNGVNGLATNFGYVRELDTRGTSASNMAVGDETWAVGDILYIHPTVAGKVTKVAPTSGMRASVAVITNRHATQGEIFVRATAFDENAYATASQGELADSALQSGDNVSELTNDSGFITDYTVTEGDVTAHQAALSIANTQVTGLGTASTQNVGTSANNVVQLNGSGALPAVDGSNLTNVSSVATLNDLTDVDTTGVSDGETIVYNSTTSSWEPGVAGGNTTSVGWENNATITSNYTMTSGNNMVSAGPITIDTGYTVTVPTGSRWVVV
jgi:hypothetical protein